MHVHTKLYPLKKKKEKPKINFEIFYIKSNIL